MTFPALLSLFSCLSSTKSESIFSESGRIICLIVLPLILIYCKEVVEGSLGTGIPSERWIVANVLEFDVERGSESFTSVKVAFIWGETVCNVPQTVVPFFSSTVTCSLRSFLKKLTSFMILLGVLSGPKVKS